MTGIPKKIQLHLKNPIDLLMQHSYPQNRLIVWFLRIGSVASNVYWAFFFYKLLFISLTPKVSELEELFSFILLEKSNFFTNEIYLLR